VAQASTEYVVTSSEELFEPGINLYPVPVSTELTVQVNFENNHRPATLNVYNAVGELMLSQDVTNGQYRINVSNWKSGVYLIKVNGQDTDITKRFVKE
jgi:hypothetical protein